MKLRNLLFTIPVILSLNTCKTPEQAIHKYTFVDKQDRVLLEEIRDFRTQKNYIKKEVYNYINGAKKEKIFNVFNEKVVSNFFNKEGTKIASDTLYSSTGKIKINKELYRKHKHRISGTNTTKF